MTFNILSIVFSALALILSSVVAQRQLGASRNSDATTVLLELLKEYRSPEMVADRARIMSRLNSPNVDPSKGFRGLPDDMRLSVQRVSHFFDQVGLLISHDLAPTDALISFFGAGAIQYWHKLYEYLAAERTLRAQPQYQIYFEIFVDQSVKADPINLLIELQRRMSFSRRTDGRLQLRTRIRQWLTPHRSSLRSDQVTRANSITEGPTQQG
jgi:hypothetical protein